MRLVGLLSILLMSLSPFLFITCVGARNLSWNDGTGSEKKTLDSLGFGYKSYEALKQGELSEAKRYLAKANTSDPFAMYVRARLTPDAVSASDIYKEIVAEAPGTPVAVAALKQLYDFHYAAGDYVAARTDSIEMQKLLGRSSAAGTKPIGERANEESVPTMRSDATPQSSVVDSKPVSYAVQLGAFSSTANAKRYIVSLRRKGVDGKIHIIHGRARTLYAVDAGEFQTRELAQRFANELRRKSIDCMVVGR